MSGSSRKYQPRIVALYCANTLSTQAELGAAMKAAEGFAIRPVELPCSSKAELSHLMKLLAEGADAVQIIACPEDNCQFLVGGVRADRRVARGRSLLKQAGLGEERLGIAHGRGLTAREFLELLERRARLVRGLGKNPASLEDQA